MAAAEEENTISPDSARRRAAALGDDRVLVRPRYLAGDTDETGMADTVLVSEFHWPMWVNAQGEQFASSPSHQIRVGLLPAPYTDWPWQMASHEDCFAPQEPDWTAFFSWETPQEILAAFHRAVAETLDNDYHRRSSWFEPRPLDHAFAPLVEASWTHHAERFHTTCTSPDGFAVAALHFDEDSPPNPAFGWTFSVGAGTLHWEAILGMGTPPHLVRALFAAVVDPAPVRRHRHELPEGLGSALQIDRAPSPETSPGPPVAPHPRITEPPSRSHEGRRR
ncbi:hypothetical protein ABH940_005598 [Streptacidiphilus sp. BW17]|uniref:DUF317 domain-containing protein n=1 Tax=Streptacidiphilus sp. BW17 TaxID=3156274 RepID=UPI003513323B